MAAAVVQAQIGTAGGAGSPALADAEGGGGIKFNREDTKAGVTPIPVPTSAGTAFSWRKVLGLVVTTVGTTSMSNRRVRHGGSLASGMCFLYRNYVVGSYAVATSANNPADNASSAATNTSSPPAVRGTPASPVYTALTSSNLVYDASTVATSGSGLNGQLVELVLGVDDTYAGGAGSAQPVPSVFLVYDEA